jgi:hypothetical protein
VLGKSEERRAQFDFLERPSDQIISTAMEYLKQYQLLNDDPDESITPMV